MKIENKKRKVNQKINVPTSKKLKLYKRGFGDMEQIKKKDGINLSKGTAGYQILEVLKKYGTYEEDKLYLHVTNKQPLTITRAIKKLETSGYIVRDKVDGKSYLSLSRYSKKVFDIMQEKVTIPRKLKRLGNISVTKTMFDMSKPEIDMVKADGEDWLELKNEIAEKHPGSEKVLGTSRMIGVYHHYGECIPVFYLGNTMRWIDNIECQVKDYMEQSIYGIGITKAIYLVDNYANEAMKYIKAPEDATRNYGESFRQSLELASCYKQAFIFAVSNSGLKQLQLYRSLPNADEAFLQAVFEDDQIERSPDNIVDGNIDGKECVVVFDGDIIKIKRLRRVIMHRALNSVNIICYTFQEPFLRKVFEEWIDRVDFYCYTLNELKEVFDI